MNNNNYLTQRNKLVLVRYKDKKILDNFINNTKFKNKIGKECFISSYEQKKNILGEDLDYDFENSKVTKKIYNFDNYNILDIIIKIAIIRNNQDLHTFILLDDSFQEKENKFIYRVLEENSINYKEIELNEDISNNGYSIPVNNIKNPNIDIVGDVHGLYDEFISLITKCGYYIENNIIKHPENRKILFLGDIVDKGQKSIEMIKLVYNSVVFGNHYAIIGNHENKILQFKKHYDKFGHINTASFASSETILELFKLEKSEFNKYINFVQELPSYYVHKNIVFAHANIENFSPNVSIKYKLMYGSGKDDITDKKYDELYNLGYNKYILIRGHNPQKNPLNSVLSLDMDQATLGHLALLPLDKFISDSKTLGNVESFKKNVIKEKVNFNYDEHLSKFNLYKKMLDFERDGLLFKQSDDKKSLSLFKHSNKLKNENYFHYSEDILRANGIVFDFAGNIVINPMNKLYDYGEIQNKQFYEDRKFVVREKVFGQLLNVSINPFNKNLIYSSSLYINDIKMKDDFKFLLKNNNGIIEKICSRNLTLTFCKSLDKVYLVNARKNDNSQNDLSESALDDLCAEINIDYIKRPEWKKEHIEKIFNEIIENEEQYVGYVFRSENNEEYLFNLNSLATDFFRILSVLSNSGLKSNIRNRKVIKNKFNKKFHDFIDFVYSKKISLNNISDESKYKIIDSYFEDKY